MRSGKNIEYIYAGWTKLKYLLAIRWNQKVEEFPMWGHELLIKFLTELQFLAEWNLYFFVVVLEFKNKYVLNVRTNCS